MRLIDRRTSPWALICGVTREYRSTMPVPRCAPAAIQSRRMAISAGFVLFSSAVILYQTSSIIHGGEDNYIMATITLFVSIYNLFLSLLPLLGLFSED